MSYLYKDLKKKVALEILSGFSFLIPALGGLSLLIAAWAFSIGPLALLGVLGFLASGAVAATRFLLNGKSIEERVIEKIKREVASKDRAKLDELHVRLSNDGDYRTETALKDLRNLRVSLHNCETRDNIIGAAETINLVEQMFNQTIVSLERTLALRTTISRLSNKEAREQLVDQREEIIDNIEKSIVEVGKVVGSLQVLANSDISEQAALRDELAESMKVVKQVHKSMTNWQQGNFNELDSEIQEVVT